MRVLPKSYIDELKRNGRYKETKEESKPIRRSSKEVAIERAQVRASVLDAFCRKYKVSSNSELVKAIKSIFRNPATKNIPIAEYKKELDIIGKSIDTVGMDVLNAILITNSSRGYKYLIYDNQIENVLKSQSKTTKDNIPITAQKNTKQVQLSDFNDYRAYLNNPEDDKELKAFIREKLGVMI